MKTRISGRNISHVDIDTGEELCNTKGYAYIDDGKLTDSQKKRKEYEKSHIMHFEEGNDFVKMYTETVWKLAQKLSPKEFTVAIALSKFVDYETCALVAGYGKGRHDMDLHEISDELFLEYSGICKIFRSLIAKGVIGEFKTGTINGHVSKRYYMNPYIYINGKNPDKEIISNFSNTGWKQFIEN